MLKDRVTELEFKYENLQEMLQLIDEYSRHVMNQTMVQLGIMIAIASAVILGAAYFMIKGIINNKVDKEVEKKVLKVLRESPPIYYARGIDNPDSNNRIYLDSNLNGIEDLEPNSVMMIEAKSEKATFGQLGGGLKPRLKINENGIREIELGNYVELNGEIAWTLAWVRKKYS